MDDHDNLLTQWRCYYTNQMYEIKNAPSERNSPNFGPASVHFEFFIYFYWHHNYSIWSSTCLFETNRFYHTSTYSQEMAFTPNAIHLFCPYLCDKYQCILWHGFSLKSFQGRRVKVISIFNWPFI